MIAEPILTAPYVPRYAPGLRFSARFATVPSIAGLGGSRYDAILDLLMQCEPPPCAEADDAAPLVEWRD